MHALLKRQLQKLGATENQAPGDGEAWSEFLQTVSRAYDDADRERYTLERSLDISSAEMQVLYQNLRDKSESRLASERDRLQAVMTALGAGLVVVDRDGKVVSANPECTRLLGYEASELQGQFLPQVLAPGQGEALWARWNLGTGGTFRDEDASFVTKSSDRLWASYTVSPIVEADGPQGAVVVFVDQGSLKRSEAVMIMQQHELEKARDAAELASRAKSDFLATMSHEIRTPMNGILGLTNLLLEMAPAPRERTYLELVQSSGNVLLALINDILDFSKIEAGRLEVREVPLLLAPAIEEIFALLQSRAHEKGIVLVAEPLPPSTAPSPHAGKVLADPVRLRQVLMNLVGNAIKFSSQGRVTVRVEPVPHVAARLRISVIDEGIGIPAERLGLLFQKFSQVDSSGSRRFEGTGLGLAICRNLVELMGGVVGVASEPDRGSTFWFTLPSTDRPVLVENPIDEQDPARTAFITALLARKRVLLVDDNRVNRLVGQKMLERLGCSVDLAGGGQEAVQMVGRCDYDLVFMDCQMPGMDGYAATRAIRAGEGSRRRVPIVAFTANAMSGEQEHCLASGMDDFLTKPIRPAELKSIVMRWMLMAWASEAVAAAG